MNNNKQSDIDLSFLDINNPRYCSDENFIKRRAFVESKILNRYGNKSVINNLDVDVLAPSNDIDVIHSDDVLFNRKPELFLKDNED